MSEQQGSTQTYHPKAILSSIDLGCKSSTYIHDNRNACIENYRATHPNCREQECKAWFSEVGTFNQMADFRSNSWDGCVVAGPFITKEEALEAAEQWINRWYS